MCKAPLKIDFINASPGFLFRNGLIVDGTGGKPFQGDILVQGDRIKAVSDTPISVNETVVDCRNRVIAPGIIDMHSHMDWVVPIVGHDELNSRHPASGFQTSCLGKKVSSPNADL